MSRLIFAKTASTQCIHDSFVGFIQNMTDNKKFTITKHAKPCSQTLCHL